MGQNHTTELQPHTQIKRGRYTRWLLPGLRGLTLNAIRHAEEKHGRPVYVTEIVNSWREISNLPDF